MQWRNGDVAFQSPTIYIKEQRQNDINTNESVILDANATADDNKLQC